MAFQAEQKDVRDVLVLFNPQSGVVFKPSDVINALSGTWDVEQGINLFYQESKSPEDGVAKVRRALERGTDTVIVVGGDGMVNTIGSQLVGTKTRLAVLPAGSGNGFARHFDIPVRPEKAAKALLAGQTMDIDVGFVNGRPFFITASLAWDAELAKGFERSPVRGIAPYVFAGIYRYFTYEPQVFKLTIDGQQIRIHRPLLMTAANLTQFGGGAKIAPDTRADDGLLTLVVVPHMEALELVSKIHHLFDGTIQTVPEVQTFAFSELKIDREREDPIQLDGELMEAGREITIKVKPKALRVIVPHRENAVRSGK
ncbi:MAG: putative lipid kinase YegS [Calditrichaeota bacterium]|nr:putative lipid kinase YegS [Calditrichota bacterium]